MISVLVLLPWVHLVGEALSSVCVLVCWDHLLLCVGVLQTMLSSVCQTSCHISMVTVLCALSGP